MHHNAQSLALLLSAWCEGDPDQLAAEAGALRASACAAGPDDAGRLAEAADLLQDMADSAPMPLD